MNMGPKAQLSYAVCGVNRRRRLDLAFLNPYRCLIIPASVELVSVILLVASRDRFGVALFGQGGCPRLLSPLSLPRAIHWSWSEVALLLSAGRRAGRLAGAQAGKRADRLSGR